MWRDGRELPRIRMPEVRFWSKVDIRGPNECWEWTASTFHGGYGLFLLDGRRQRANRLALMLGGACLSGELCALHSCHNPGCCNPGHLRPGTHADNAADKVAAGRVHRAAGELQGGARLTARDVRAIRAAVERGELHRVVAARHGVSRSSVGQIVQRKTWAHIP